MGVPVLEERVCVVVPGYNEASHIAQVVADIRQYAPDVFVIDDGSEDDTKGEAERAGAMVVRQEVNRGKGVSLNVGFEEAQKAGYDLILTMDADGQHDPADIPKFLEAYQRTKIPVLVGNRMAATEDMPLVRRLTNLFMSWLLSKVMKQYVPDTQCGYRMYRSDVLPFIVAASERFAAESETLLRVAERGIRIDSVSIKTIYGDEKSKINPFVDTYRFFSMLLGYLRQRKQRRR